MKLKKITLKVLKKIWFYIALVLAIFVAFLIVFIEFLVKGALWLIRKAG